MAETRTLTIDGKEYDPDEFSEEARKQLVNVRITDQEIERRQQQLAIAQTARRAYARALAEALPEPQPESKTATNEDA